MARRHWIWDAYRALTQERRMTEAEAIGELTGLWPSLPVFEIVRAEGDTSRTLDSIMGQGQGSSNGQQAPQSQQSQGNQQGSSDGQEAAQEPDIDPNDMNALIRQRASQKGAHTVTLPREALTGVKGQAEYDPAADIFRSRYAEKYGS